MGICLLHATLPDRGHDGSRHGAISHVDVEVRCCWQLIFVWERHDGGVEIYGMVSQDLVEMQMC